MEELFEELKHHKLEEGAFPGKQIRGCYFRWDNNHHSFSGKNASQFAFHTNGIES